MNNIPDPSNAPKPTLAQQYERFVQAGNKPEDFALPLAITPTSITYAQVKSIRERLGFPTSVEKLPKKGVELPPSIIELIGRVNLTAKTLGLPEIKEMV